MSPLVSYPINSYSCVCVAVMEPKSFSIFHQRKYSKEIKFDSFTKINFLQEKKLIEFLFDVNTDFSRILESGFGEISKKFSSEEHLLSLKNFTNGNNFLNKTLTPIFLLDLSIFPPTLNDLRANNARYTRLWWTPNFNKKSNRKTIKKQIKNDVKNKFSVFIFHFV